MIEVHGVWLLVLPQVADRRWFCFENESAV
jgi:hypothetical protein